MPLGSRLVLALVMAVLGSAGARAGQSAGSWTDPPARAPAPQSEAPAAAAPPKVEAPPVQRAAPPVARAETPRKPAKAVRREARRVTPQRPRIVARAAPREARVERRVVQAAPRRLRYAEPLPVGVVPTREAMADPRLERLGSAEAAGYLVVRRRTIVYPDGRAIRIYRPAEEGGLFD